MTPSKKKFLRNKIKERKQEYSFSELTGLSNELFDRLEQEPFFRNASTIFIYHSLSDEVQTHSFIKKWKDKKKFLLPVVKGDYLELRYYTDNHLLCEGRFGIKEPTGETCIDYSVIDLAIIPGVSFDLSGNRLGRGKGFYDRLLLKVDCMKVGICFAFQLVNQLPCDDHDIRMDIVITENGIIRQ